MTSSAVFLDRDGVINAAIQTAVGLDSPRHRREFEMLPRVGPAIRTLNALGMPVVVVSNQPGPAKGKFGVDELEAMTALMKAQLEESDARVDGVYYCLHHPDAVVGAYRVTCNCRKPKPGLLVQASSELGLDLRSSYMVGDQSRDMLAGKAVGCKTILVGAAPDADAVTHADHVQRDLPSAVTLILELETLNPAARRR